MLATYKRKYTVSSFYLYLVSVNMSLFLFRHVSVPCAPFFSHTSLQCTNILGGGLMYLGAFDYLVLNAKLLLINMNYVEFFPFFTNFIDRKNLTNFFILVDLVN